MDIAELEAFVGVAETHSFSQAAERLYLTQPAISKRVAALESRLDIQLFNRRGRQIELTQGGKALLPRAQHILQQLEDARRALTALNADVSGTLTLGTSHHIGLHRLPPVLKQYAKAFPRVSLEFQFIDSEQAFDLVVQGQIELGIVTLPPRYHGPLAMEPVWFDPLTVLAAPDHPLARFLADSQELDAGNSDPSSSDAKTSNARGPAALQLSQLANHPAILPGANTFTRRIVEAKFSSAELDVNVAISTNYLETIKMMTSVGLGWTVLPATMVDASVVSLPVTDLSLSRQLGVVYHPSYSLSNAARELLKLLRAQA